MRTLILFFLFFYKIILFLLPIPFTTQSPRLSFLFCLFILQNPTFKDYLLMSCTHFHVLSDIVSSLTYKEGQKGQNDQLSQYIHNLAMVLSDD